MTGLDVGQSYEAGALIADGSPKPARAKPVQDYVASGRPGARLPHGRAVDLTPHLSSSKGRFVFPLPIPVVHEPRAVVSGSVRVVRDFVLRIDRSGSTKEASGIDVDGDGDFGRKTFRASLLTRATKYLPPRYARLARSSLRSIPRRIARVC